MKTNYFYCWDQIIKICLLLVISSANFGMGETAFGKTLSQRDCIIKINGQVFQGVLPVYTFVGVPVVFEFDGDCFGSYNVAFWVAKQSSTPAWTKIGSPSVTPSESAYYAFVATVDDGKIPNGNNVLTQQFGIFGVNKPTASMSLSGFCEFPSYISPHFIITRNVTSVVENGQDVPLTYSYSVSGPSPMGIAFGGPGGNIDYGYMEPKVDNPIPGDYTVTAIASAAGIPGGFESAPVSQSINCSSHVNASVTANPTSINLGGTVTFTAAATNGDGNYHYAWSISQNVSGNMANLSGGDQPSVTFSPTVSGAYKVSVVVTDGVGGEWPADSPVINVGGTLGISAEVHVGQVILDPSWSHQAAIDLVNGKTMFAVLKLKNSDGTAAAGKTINNYKTYYDTVGNGNPGDFYTGRIPSKRTNVTDENGQIYFIFPGAYSTKSSGSTTKLFVEYDDPVTGTHVSDKSTTVAFWNTRSTKIGYSQISECNTNSGVPPDCYGPMSSNFNFQNNMNQSSLFLSAVFPIKDGGITPIPLQSFKGFPDVRDANGVLTTDGICLDLRYAKQIVDQWQADNAPAHLEKTALFVPVASGGKKSYFDYHYPPPHPAWGGESDNGQSAVLVNEEKYTTVAHEFSHSYCVRFDNALGCAAGPIPTGQNHFSCNPDPNVPENCKADISGYNGVDSPQFDPVGPISKKLPFFGNLFVPFSDHLELTWIDQSTYLQLFRSFVPGARVAAASASESGLRIGVRLDATGTPVLEYASPTVFDPNLDNQGVESNVIFIGLTRTNDQLFSIKAQSQGQGVGLGQFSLDRNRDSFDCGATKEYVVSYGYDLDKINVQPGNRAAPLTIVPSIAILQTQVSTLPDEAFTGNASAQRAGLISGLVAAQTAYVAGDITGASSQLSAFSNLLQTTVSDSFSPSGGLQINKSTLNAGVQDAVVRTVGGGQSSNVKGNGFISVAQISSSGQTTYLGHGLTSPSSQQEELLIRATVGGTPRQVEVHSDGTFALKSLPGDSGAIIFAGVLRNRRESNTYRSAISETEQQIATLNSALDTVQDPLLRERILLQINGLIDRAHVLSAHLAGLERSVGTALQF